MNFLHKIISILQYNANDPLLFNSIFFLVFFFLFLSIFYIVAHNPVKRVWVIVVFSFYFFYKACGWFFLFMLLAALIDYLVSNSIAKSNKPKTKRMLLVISIIANLGLLFYFKYTNFFIGLINDIASGHIKPIHIVLPVGISFYTFENISYTVDVYRGTIQPVKKFINYLAFLAFFPKLMMGPIIRAKDFIPQLFGSFKITKEQVNNGWFLIASGLFKKMIIADFLYANYVERVFDNPKLYTGFECLMATYSYALVIYGDFSGYSNMALGIALWMGITLNQNFDSPYQASSITEFWRRWHISLSS